MSSTPKKTGKRARKIMALKEAVSGYASVEAREKIVVLGKRNQITIPREMIPKGTNQFMCEVENDGSIRLIPCVPIPKSQLYFWTKRWQEGEKKASEDIRAERVTEYDSADDLIAELDRRRKKSRRSV